MRKGERTKQTIIEKSIPLFNQHGYQATSMSDIMKETGLEKGGIYRHFQSKEELSVQAFLHSIQLMRQQFQEHVFSKQTAVEQCAAFIFVIKQLMFNRPIPGGCPVLNASLEADDANPVLANLSKEAMSKLLAAYQKVLKDGIARGELDPSTPLEALSVLWLSSLEGALALSRLYQDEKYIDLIGEHLQQDLRRYLL
ncbi:TetR/AcrR family transcriptional regulator [Brevibacillus ginsengisoli]|uniref:TetR/AcrR family transcriptional regulator n=1 Tax=Brevibacillus ginsengisoli TaxID=363854 RepID=UPI003CF2F34A